MNRCRNLTHRLRHVALLLALTALCGAPQRVLAADVVTAWSRLASGGEIGEFDPHATTLMHAAMHDTLNAITPRYARWTAATPDEPPAANAAPEAAVAAAAHAVLLAGSEPENSKRIDAALAAALNTVPDGPRKAAGIALGKAIAAATLAHRAGGGDVPIAPFTQSNKAGHWRATPPDIKAQPPLARYQPFSGAAALDIPVANPPKLGSPAYIAAVTEVRSLGDELSKARSEEQTLAAYFFADQTSHLNFIDLAIRLLEARPVPQDIWDSAPTMTLMSIALSDAWILTARAKERFHLWRPITAIREGGFGVTPDAGWQPLVVTPQHPEYPSGHAAECAAGAAVLRFLFRTDAQPVRYIATDGHLRLSFEYPGFTAIADECAASRLWAGVHYRFANDAGQRLGKATAHHVVSAVCRPPREKKRQLMRH